MTAMQANGMQQHPDALKVWSRFFSEYAVANILEIGSGFGGFARFLAEKIGNESTVVTCDIKKKWNDPWPDNVVFLLHDAYQGAPMLETMLRVMARPVLLICDGRRKKWEARRFGPLLHVGDFLAIHDYASTREWFDQNLRNKVWNWHECDERAIASVLAEGFTPILENKFSNVAWGVWLKEAQT